MANTTAYAPFDMSQFAPSSGVATVATSTLIRIVEGEWSQEYYGNGFRFNELGELTGGTLTGTTAWKSGVSQYRIDGLNHNILVVEDLLDDPLQLLDYLFAGNDSFTGSGGPDVLLGFRGADSISGNGGADFLGGGAGADTLAGGAGDDTYLIDASDVITEGAAGGIDTVVAGVSYTLTAELENLVLLGTASLGGTGTARANLIVGNSGDNLLAGGAGNDRIYGGAGMDRASLSGNSADYELVSSAGSRFLVDRNAVDGNDGADALGGVEVLKFADHNLYLSETPGRFLMGGGLVLPAVGGLADGGFVAVSGAYGVESGTSEFKSYGLFAQRYAGDGSRVGEEFQVNTFESGDQNSAAVTGLADGGFLIAWDSSIQDGGTWPDWNYGVFAQRYDSGGNPVGAEFEINTTTAGTQGGPAVAALPDGGFVATWYSFDQAGPGSGFDIYVQRFDASAARVGSEFLVNTTLSGYQLYPEVVVFDTGEFVVTWSDTAVHARRFGADGDPLGDEFLVSSAGSGIPADTSMAGLANGSFAVAWAADSSDGNGYEVYARLFNTAGDPAGNAFPVNTYRAGDQNGTSVVALGSGGFVVMWGSSEQDAGGPGVYGQLYSAQGAAIGPEFHVGTQNERSGYVAALLPASTALADGGFVVGWTSPGDDAVVGQRFDDGANPLGDPVLTGSATADVLRGGAGRQVLLGLDGNDALTGGDGADTLRGGEGNDTLDSGAGADTLEGGEGDDVLIAGAGMDALRGGGGADVLFSNDEGADTLAGGVGDDIYLIDGGGADTVLEAATGGADAVFCGAVSTLIPAYVENLFAGYGLFGATGTAVTLTGSANAEGLHGSDGNDTLLGRAGNDVLEGGAGKDMLDGGAGIDTLRGGGGDDTYAVTAGDVVAENATQGADTVKSAVAWVLGDNLERLLLTGALGVSGTGNALANTLTGNGARNALSGLDGNDTLDGGPGSDTLTGGAGKDAFVFSTEPAALTADRITDFTHLGDRLRLDDDVFMQFTAGVGVKAVQFFAAAGAVAAHDADDRIIYDTSSGMVYYDADGNLDGGVGAVLFAVLTAHPTLTPADFLIVA